MNSIQINHVQNYLLMLVALRNLFRNKKLSQICLKHDTCKTLNAYFGEFLLKLQGLCIAITAILHYLFLVTFFSMLGMGIYYFMSITVTYYAMSVANNFKAKSRIQWFLIGVWGELEM